MINWLRMIVTRYKCRHGRPVAPFLSTPNSGRLSTPLLNTTTPSRWCSSIGTPSPRRNWAGEPPPLLCHPLPVSRSYTPLLLQLIGLYHLPRHPRAAKPRHHHRSSPEHHRPRRNATVPPHPPPRRHLTPIGGPHRHPSCPVTSTHHPRAHTADCATREPPENHGRPRHCAAARCADWHGPAGPLYRLG
jgi:hypothetical protein